MAGYNYNGQMYGYPCGGGYYPAAYQPMVQQPVVQPQVQPVQNAPGRIQNGGFVTVRSEAEARDYPVAPGTSVTFKHETAPYCYTKTMGFSQFEAPRFEKFRLIKEEDGSGDVSKADVKEAGYATQDELGKLVGVVQSINSLVGTLKSDVDNLKSDMYGALGKRKTVKKPEASDDDA